MQEINTSGNPTQHFLTGLGIDEVFVRTNGSGGAKRLPLTDALGSTLALAMTDGSFAASYAYEPYGAATISGDPVGYPFTYTGREDDGTGLYYYRARYYSPEYGRFISQDPIGFAGGLNFYAYVGGNPISFVDPIGLAPSTICNGPDCVNPPYDPTPDGPKPSPQPPNPKPDNPAKKKSGPSCDIQPTFAACMACCSTVNGQLRSGGVGGSCAESCYRKAGITMNDDAKFCEAKG